MSARNERIIAEFLAGDSFGIIADRMGISRCAVAGVLGRAGIRRKIPPNRHPARGWAIHLSGEDHPMSKLTAADIHLIRASRESLKTLSSRYSITVPYACKVRNGHAWKHIP